MSEFQNILISLSPQFTEALAEGRKTVELRRRHVRIAPGGKVWIYSKSPQAMVEAVGIVKRTVFANPNYIWQLYGPYSGLTRNQFDDYFVGIDCGCAIEFLNVQLLPKPAKLSLLREKLGAFHPPQFFKYLRPGSSELNYFEKMGAASLRAA